MLEPAVRLIGIHFEKGHYIVTSWFEPTVEGIVTPSKMTLLAQGYARADQIVIHLWTVTYLERIARSVWFRLAEEHGEESAFATAEEVRPILVHREHAQNEGNYACDCGIDLQQQHPAGAQIWRVNG
jgi:hypothetical protein